MKCFRCGAELAETVRFCSNCGLQMTDPQEETFVLPPEDSEEMLRRVRMVLSGEYEVERELGRGGMAMIYRATEVALGRKVALKVLPPEAGMTARASERFKREARMVAELDHPNIIPVYRVGQVGGILYIVMKLIEGSSLDMILAVPGGLPTSVVVYVMRGVARALAYAHERGIVHRDIKGGNVLIDHDGRVLVSDFGVALRSADVTLTVDGSLIGTPSFMSPEQCSGQRAGPQSDQYSLGVLGFQMLTGTVPFHADTLQGVMHHHFFTPVPDIRQAREDVPDALIGLIEQALNKDPAQRFSSTREMLAALEAIPFSEEQWQFSESTLKQLTRGEQVNRVDTHEMPALPDAPTISISSPGRLPRRQVTTRAAAVAALLLVVGIGAWWFGRSGVAAGDPAVVVSPAETTGAPGKIRISTRPTDAEIMVDGQLLGKGKVYDALVNPGTRRLTVQAAGYATLDTSVVVLSQRTLTLTNIILHAQ